MGKDKMQRGGSINPASFLQKPQFNVHDPSLSCFMVVDAVGICHTMSKKKKKGLIVIEHKPAAETCVLTLGNIADS